MGFCFLRLDVFLVCTKTVFPSWSEEKLKSMLLDMGRYGDNCQDELHFRLGEAFRYTRSLSYYNYMRTEIVETANCDFLVLKQLI